MKITHATRQVSSRISRPVKPPATSSWKLCIQDCAYAFRVLPDASWSNAWCLRVLHRLHLFDSAENNHYPNIVLFWTMAPALFMQPRCHHIVLCWLSGCPHLSSSIGWCRSASNIMLLRMIRF
jgi:hypothetical protein